MSSRPGVYFVVGKVGRSESTWNHKKIKNPTFSDYLGSQNETILIVDFPAHRIALHLLKVIENLTPQNLCERQCSSFRGDVTAQ
ncbi:hypothetical protein ABIF70_006448 [Bradyrhizobium japonicum]